MASAAATAEADLQGTGKGGNRQKTYDIHHMEENEEVANYTMAEPEADEETILQAMLDEGDEDASFIQDFEEQVILTCQDSQELSSCFTAYQEARDRLREKARTRGYWPLKSGNKGKGRGKKGKGYGGGSYGSSMAINVKRRSLAERIANSTCRRCGQPGHWRRECPLNNSETSKDKTAFTGVSMDDATEDVTAIQDVLTTLPEDAELFDQDGEDQAESKTVGSTFLQCAMKQPQCLTLTDQPAQMQGSVRSQIQNSVFLRQGPREQVMSKMLGEKSQPYLTTELQLPVDESLEFKEIHNQDGEIRKPPGVTTLEEWGKIHAPSGKHPGKTFQEIFDQDPNYVFQLRNRRGVSAWVRSFQMYARARNEIINRNLQAERQQQMPIQPRATTEINQEWTAVHCPRTPAEVGTSKKGELKRSASEEKSGMNIEKNQDKITDLQTKIAVLQRELARETERSSSSGQSKEMILGLEGHEEPEMAPEALQLQKRRRPAKISLTVFGYSRERHGNEANMMRSAEPKVAAFAAKNSLSRIHGFTPEQCLLGKSKALPASLTSDEEVGVVAGNPEESEGYSPSVGVSMSNGQENSQPENEMFPPESLTSGDPDEGKDVGDTGEKDLEPHEIPVPDEEDGLFAFGDDLEPPSEKPGVWEINFGESHWNDKQSNHSEVSSEQIHVFFAEQVMIASTARDIDLCNRSAHVSKQMDSGLPNGLELKKDPKGRDIHFNSRGHCFKQHVG
ncbi:unnamed protein product [Cladocopium goreaui]|uniref:CCHC-type domain-containing protein n=1 Tax=Cladocopium goreaui TaxID=2562237 RepID=A0A9P1GDP7_9DINO|nr:unnamed protein product [Cladocopium goreaui]